MVLKNRILALLLIFFSPSSFADPGDIDLTINVLTKHVNKSTYYLKALGETPYFEDNNHIGIRYGINKYLSAGLSFGKSSYGKDSLLGAIELTHPVTKYMKVGVMAGLANGYDAISSNGLMFVGGPTVIARTPYLGVTVGLYAMEALVVTIDIPIKTTLR